MDKKILNITTLGLKDGYYVIDNTKDVIYKNDAAANIFITNGAFAEIIDYSSDAKISYKVDKSSSLKLHILNTKNTNRIYEIYGEAFINHISLDETTEKLNAYLLDENANFNYKLLSILKDKESIFEQKVDHNFSKTFSNISNFGVAFNGAKILFDTTGFIAKEKDKSNCRQLSKGVVMDDLSSITSKPILLIDEFDCFASHGAAIGKMSDEELFYLMSRGLSKNEAFLLILNGIIKPFIDEISIDEVKFDLDKKLKELISE